MTVPQSRKSARRARWPSTGHGRARPDIPQPSQIVGQLVEFKTIRRAFVSDFTVAQLVAHKYDEILLAANCRAEVRKLIGLRDDRGCGSGGVVAR